MKTTPGRQFLRLVRVAPAVAVCEREHALINAISRNLSGFELAKKSQNGNSLAVL